MDSIYLDRPCEKLDLKKIRTLNEVRRPLLDHYPISAVNVRLRTAFGRGVRLVRPAQVLEWGCGYHPLCDLIGDARYTGLDVDPSVIADNRERHPDRTWRLADEELDDIPPGSQDVIVSSFVFHFRLSRTHIATMRRVLTPTGIVLANVYRRSAGSRRELARRFERAGLRLHRREDPAELCTDHEFWCLTRQDCPDPGVAAAVLGEVAWAVTSG